MQRIEGFIVETESDADMTAPGWQQAFSVSRHEAAPNFGWLRHGQAAGVDCRDVCQAVLLQQWVTEGSVQW